MTIENYNADISFLEQPQKPSDKAIQALKEWRDSTEDEWKQEALDSNIEWLENEVDQ